MKIDQNTLIHQVRVALTYDYRVLDDYYVSTTKDGLKLEHRHPENIEGSSVFVLSLNKIKRKPKKSNKNR